MTDTTSAAPSDAEIEALAAEHLKAFAQFSGAGDVWVEGEVAFARAVLAKWGAPQPVVREPLTGEQIAAIWAQKPRYHAAPIGKTDIEFARAIEAAVREQDEALIRQCMEALECAGAYTALIDDISLSAIQEAYKAASARLEGKP